ncbi:class I SAM-dependent methyltransferase [Vibrio rarus]|uniref:class I SAM-dependent methyltransferase n=1 Tax=Vibrio rarus TaxID=413403 RepID=UPI0021C30AB2|nr:class I SAM-dependent methyltransferase [Vibrio rarus]
MNSTTQYYNQNAQQFFDSTVDVEMQSLYQTFLPLLPHNARILDAGCGSGRDSQAFLQRGYSVDAFDASSKLVTLARQLTGCAVSQSTFMDFTAQPNSYDGIWACASLLHVPESELKATFIHLSQFLKSSGLFYCSFKLGEQEVERNGRFFCDLTARKLHQMVSSTQVLTVASHWETRDVRAGRENEKWLNAILKKRV